MHCNVHTMSVNVHPRLRHAPNAYGRSKSLFVILVGCFQLNVVDAGILASSSIEKCVRTERVRRWRKPLWFLKTTT